MKKTDVLVKYGCMMDMQRTPEEQAKITAESLKLAKFKTVCCGKWIKSSNLELTDKGFVCKEGKGCKRKNKLK